MRETRKNIERRFNRRVWLQTATGITAGALAGGKAMAQTTSSQPSPGGSPQTGVLPPPTLRESLLLAGQNMLTNLNPDDNYLPFWAVNIWPDYRAEMKIQWEAHNIGRWWDAMLRIEEAVGFVIPKPIEAAMLQNTHRFFDNPDCICMDPKTTVEWDLHSLREGLLALNALVRWRKDEWALNAGRRMVQSLNAKLGDDCTWEFKKFEATRTHGNVRWGGAACDTHGRLLEALIWFYETTGDVACLQLGERIARWHFENTTLPDGTMNPRAKADHTHSYLGTIRGLLLWGQLTGQHQYIERVAKTYEVTVPRMVRPSGYTSHNISKETGPETTSPGDAAQLALWLSRDGYGELLDDVERIVRARILPSQVLETPPLKSKEGKDKPEDLEKRMIGAYGGCHTHPHGGKRPTTDVTAADIHTLADIYTHIAVWNGDMIDVLFHLDYEDTRVRVACRRGQRAELTVTPKTEATVAIRAPKWMPRESVHVRVGGDVVKPVFAGAFLFVGHVPAGSAIVMAYDLPAQSNRETDKGVEYEVFWRGDDVIGVRPNTKFYPFYPDAPATKQ